MMSEWHLLEEQGRREFALHLVLAEYDGPSIAVFLSEAEEFFGVAADEDDDWIRWLVAPVSKGDLALMARSDLSTRAPFLGDVVWVMDVERRGDRQRCWQVRDADIPADALPDEGAMLPSLSLRVLRQHVASTSFYLTRGAVRGARGADGETAGLALYAWSRLLNEHSRTRVRNQPKPARRRGTPVTPMIRPYRAGVVEALHGSFGFRIEDLSAVEDGLVDVGAIDDARDVIRRASSSDEKEFSEAIGGLESRSRAALKELVSTLAKANAGFRLAGPTEDAPVEEVDFEGIARASVRMNEIVEEQESHVVRRGIIAALIRQPRRYEFIGAEDMRDTKVKPEFGPVDPSLTDDEITLIRSYQNVPVNAQFRALTMRRDRRAQTVLTIIGIEVGGQLIGRRATPAEERGSDAPEGIDAESDGPDPDLQV